MATTLGSQNRCMHHNMLFYNSLRGARFPFSKRNSEVPSQFIGQWKFCTQNIPEIVHVIPPSEDRIMGMDRLSISPDTWFILWALVSYTYNLFSRPSGDGLRGRKIAANMAQL